MPRPAPSSAAVRAGFGRRAPDYHRQAALQRAVAWRLAHHTVPLALPPGPAADLGAGTGLLGEALQQQGLEGPLLQLDLCPELLARNSLTSQQGQCLWDLNGGLPPQLSGAALLCSSFALQWLAAPAAALRQWCQALAPGGWLALAVPTAGSFPQWQRAAREAGVPYTGLALPAAPELAAVAQGALAVRHLRLLRFSQRGLDGHHFLGSLQAIGAVGSPAPRLPTAQLRRLLQHWPSDGGVTWEVLLLVGQRRA